VSRKRLSLCFVNQPKVGLGGHLNIGRGGYPTKNEPGVDKNLNQTGGKEDE